MRPYEVFQTYNVIEFYCKAMSVELYEYEIATKNGASERSQ